jgi:preprotein translocase subunit SecG
VYILQKESDMTKKKAVILGVFTVLPFLYIISFITFWVKMFILLQNGEPNSLNHVFLIIFPIHFAIMIEIIVLLVIYIKDVFKNTYIEETKKTLWLLVLFFGNLIAMPIYWYINIWKHIPNEDKESGHE